MLIRGVRDVEISRCFEVCGGREGGGRTCNLSESIRVARGGYLARILIISPEPETTGEGEK